MSSHLVVPELILIRGGVFIMGSDAGREDEAPAHEVEVADFYMARFATTNAEYSVFLEEAATPEPPFWCDPRFNHPEQPVVAVNWFEANAYCRWLASAVDESFRLPTEAEREYACRAGTTTVYPWGDSDVRDLHGYGRRWFAGTGPEIVGGPPNPFGLCNMSDNVHEWCLDWYAKDYYRLSPRDNPLGPTAGVRRASRGGSWRHQRKVTPSAARSSIKPDFRYSDYGFRIVKPV